MKTTTEYMVVPRHRKTLKRTQESLQSLRRAVSRTWTGASAVSEIRAQRKRKK